MQLYTIMLVVITLLSTNTYIQADLSQICRDTFNSLANHLLGCSEKILSLTYMNQSWESCSNHQSIPLCFQSPCFLYSVRYWIASRACFYRWNGYWNNVSMRKSDTEVMIKKRDGSVELRKDNMYPIASLISHWLSTSFNNDHGPLTNMHAPWPYLVHSHSMHHGSWSMLDHLIHCVVTMKLDQDFVTWKLGLLPTNELYHLFPLPPISKQKTKPSCPLPISVTRT